MLLRIVCMSGLLGWSAPLMAGPARPTAIPEPTDAALFALGLLGLWLGRRASRKGPPRD